MEKLMAKEAEGGEEIERLKTVSGVGPMISLAFTVHMAVVDMTTEKGIGKKKAIVAIARRLAELLYALMKWTLNLTKVCRHILVYYLPTLKDT